MEKIKVFCKRTYFHQDKKTGKWCVRCQKNKIYECCQLSNSFFLIRGEEEWYAVTLNIFKKYFETLDSARDKRIKEILLNNGE